MYGYIPENEGRVRFLPVHLHFRVCVCVCYFDLRKIDFASSVKQSNFCSSALKESCIHSHNVMFQEIRIRLFDRHTPRFALRSPRRLCRAKAPYLD